MIAAFEFGQPAWLLLLLVGPALFWFERECGRRAIAVRRQVFGPRLATATPGAARRSARAGLLRALLVMALAVTLAGPRWGDPEVQPTPPPLDLVVCLDVSRSMLARDLQPSRLAVAQAMIAELAQRARGDRVGLIAFAGTATLRVPLTRDRAAFVQLAATTDELSVGRGGTDLGAALDAALGALVGSAGNGAVVVLTDGEDLAAGGLAAARRCAARGVPVHCIGLGSDRGAKVPVRRAEVESYLRDDAGRDVVTVPDRAGLTAIAAATGGTFLDGALGVAAIADFERQHLRSAGMRRDAAGGELGPAERFQWPLLLALLLALLLVAPPRRA